VLIYAGKEPSFPIFSMAAKMGDFHDHATQFLLVGAAKAGTSSLYYYLKGHPEVFLWTPKEPLFFAQVSRTAAERHW